jgi:hypothetical protein
MFSLCHIKTKKEIAQINALCVIFVPFLQHTLSTWDIVTASSLDCLSDSQCQSFEGGFRPKGLFNMTNKQDITECSPMVIVFTTKHINVQRYT